MTQMSDGAVIVPEGRDRYTLEFRPGGTVNVRADCNRGSATYVRNGNTLGIGPIALTRWRARPIRAMPISSKGLARCRDT